MSKRDKKQVREYTRKELGKRVGYSETWMCAAGVAGLGVDANGVLKRRVTMEDWIRWRAANPDFRVRTVRRWKASAPTRAAASSGSMNRAS
jgi:hypothetical protein